MISPRTIQTHRHTHTCGVQYSVYSCSVVVAVETKNVFISAKHDDDDDVTTAHEWFWHWHETLNKVDIYRMPPMCAD